MAHIFDLPPELVHMIVQYLYLGMIDEESNIVLILKRFCA